MESAERLMDLMFFWMGHTEEHAANLSLAATEQHAASRDSDGETTELLRSSSIRAATRHDQETSQVCTNIQQLFEQLKEQSASEQLKGVSRSVMEQLLQTLGKRDGFGEDELNFGSLIRTEEWAPRIDRSLTKNLLKILAFFSLTVEDEDLKGLFSEGFSEMKENVALALREDVKEITREGADLFPSGVARKWEKLHHRVHVTDLSQSLRSVAEGMMKAVEELRAAFTSISEAFVELKDVQECIVDPWCVCGRTKLLQYAQDHCRGHCGEAQRASAQRAADEPSGQRAVDEPSGQRAAFEPSGQRAAFDPSGQRVSYELPYEPSGQRAAYVRSRDFQTQVTFVELALSMCEDEEVRAWILQGGFTDAFLDLVDVFQLMMTKIDNERFQTGNIVSREFDIILVAHGSITGHMIPSTILRPVPSLLDVVMYQPWNCTIDATVAYDIASGYIEQEKTHATCNWDCPFSEFNHQEYHKQRNEICDSSTCDFIRYKKETNHKHQFHSNRDSWKSTWNHMSETSGNVPEIYLKTLKPPKDGAWKQFQILKRDEPYSVPDRVVIPFILRKLGDRKVPFGLVTLALSMVLKLRKLRARLHLVACLGKEEGSQLDVEALMRQYYVADDKTMMVSARKPEIPKNHLEVYEMFKDLFGEEPGSDQA